MPCYTYMFAYERCSHSDIKAAACDDRQCAHNEDEWRICDTKLRVSFHGKCERCVDHEAAAEESARRAHNSRIQALIRNQPTASPKTQAVNEGIEDREFFVRRLREEKLEAIRSEIGRAREWTWNYAKALYFLQYGLDKMKSDHEAWVAHRAQGRARLKGELDTALARQRDRYEEGIKETDDNLAEIARKRSRLSEWDVTDQSIRAAAVPDEAYDAMRRSLEQSHDLTPVWLTVLVDPTRTRDQLIEHHAQLTLTRQGQELAGWESSYAFSSSALEVNVASPIDQLLQQTEPL